MNRVDNMLRDWRIRRALPWIPEHSRVLDIGCFDAQLLKALGSRLDRGVGMDPAIERPAELGRYRLLPGEFPRVQPDDGPFDAVTLLAVLEHVPSDQIEQWARTCWDLLVPGGRVVATVPSPRVDTILDVAIRLRLMDGMEAEQHHGFAPKAILSAYRDVGFDVMAEKRFQLGLNNLFVLRKPE